MADKTYVYSGPIGGCTLREEGGRERHIQLNPGATVKVPEGHPWVKRLVAKGRLTEPPAKETPKTAPKANNQDKNQ